MSLTTNMGESIASGFVGEGVESWTDVSTWTMTAQQPNAYYISNFKGFQEGTDFNMFLLNIYVPFYTFYTFTGLTYFVHCNTFYTFN